MQVGILLTAVFEILIGLLIMRIGKAALDKILPPIVTGSMAMVIGIALANAALGNAGNWAAPEVAWKILAGGLHHPGRNHPVLGLSARQRPVGHAADPVRRDLRLPGLPFPSAWCISTSVISAAWIAVPKITFPAFTDPDAWGMALSVALIFIATVPESTAHLYQMSLYIDALAAELRPQAVRDQETDRPQPGGGWRRRPGGRLAGRLRRDELRREQQPDGHHPQLLHRRADDRRCHGDRARFLRQAGGTGQYHAAVLSWAD